MLEMSSPWNNFEKHGDGEARDILAVILPAVKMTAAGRQTGRKTGKSEQNISVTGIATKKYL